MLFVGVYHADHVYVEGHPGFCCAGQEPRVVAGNPMYGHGIAVADPQTGEPILGPPPLCDVMLHER